MNSKKRTKPMHEKKDSVSKGSDDVLFVPPVRVSKSMLVLQVTQERRVTRGSVKAVESTRNTCIDNTSTLQQIKDTNAAPLLPVGARQTSHIGNHTLPTSSPKDSSPEPHISGGTDSNSAVASLPLGNPTDRATDVLQAIPAVRVERILSVGDNGQELWGYSDEDPMEDEDAEMDEEEDFTPDLQNPAEEDELESEGDPYEEQPTLDEPSIAAFTVPKLALQAAVAKTTTGVRKGKKKVNTIVEPVLDTSPFTIRFWIKTGGLGIGKDFEILSTTRFIDFKAELAEVMGVREGSVNVVYDFSYNKVKKNAQLASQANWNTLVRDAVIYRSKPSTIRAGLKDAWCVDLKDISELSDGRGGSKKKGTAAVGVRGITPPVSSSPANPDEAEIEKRIGWINADRGCNMHGGQYCLIPTEASAPIFLKHNLKIQHLRLTDLDRRLWAEDILRGQSLRNAPSNIVVDQICSRASASRNIGSGLNVAAAHQVLPPITPSRYQYTTMMQVASTSHSIQQQENRSSGSRATPTMSVDKWLEEIDQSPSRQHQRIKYVSLIQAFADEDICTVGELISLGLDGLVKVEGVKLGTARRLLDWANSDV